MSPRIVAAIAAGTAPADLTVTSLAKALSYSWAEQEQKIGLAGQDPANAYPLDADADRVSKPKIRSVWPGNFLEFLGNASKGPNAQKLRGRGGPWLGATDK